jgi:competence protein ComEA
MTHINVNTATADELDAIPQFEDHGFEIVRYREDRGAIDALRQLEEVPGMAGNADALDDALTI